MVKTRKKSLNLIKIIQKGVRTKHEKKKKANVKCEKMRQGWKK